MSGHQETRGSHTEIILNTTLSKHSGLRISRGVAVNTQMSMAPTTPGGLDLFGISKKPGEILKFVL